MQLAEWFTAQLRQLVEHVGVQQRQAVEDAARQLGWGMGNGLRGFAAGSLNLGAHVFRVDEAVIVRVNQVAASR